MKVVFSRKGFDSSAGGVPSPIVNGRPVSIPIPTDSRSETTYSHLGLGDLVGLITKNRYSGNSLCHHDPMFLEGRCAFGQTGIAQGHLSRNNVGVGDIFLFFGLFSELDGKDRHHRIFGLLQVEEVLHLGANPKLIDQPMGFKNRHPHTIGKWEPNNTIYLGRGRTATTSDSDLRLSIPGHKVSNWRVPSWLRKAKLTYHRKRDRWGEDDTLQIVPRGQEFVSEITGNSEAHEWLEMVSTKISQVKA